MVGIFTFMSKIKFSLSWDEHEIFYDLLTSPDAETCLQNYVSALLATHWKEKWVNS